MKKILLYICVSLLPMIFACCQQLDEVPVNIPTITTLEADEIGVTSATIHGEVENMNTIYCYYYFLVSEYSDFPEDLTDLYSFRTWEPKESQGFYAEVTDLHEDATYYYVLCATDGVAEVRGEVLSFRTKTLNISVVTSDAIRVDDDPFVIYIMGTITGAGEGLSSNDIYFMISNNKTLTDRYVIYDNGVKYERSTDTYYVQLIREAYEPVYYCLGCRYEDAEILGETKVYYPFDARTDKPYVSKSGGAVTLYGASTHYGKSYFLLSKSSDLSGARLIWCDQWENRQNYPYAYSSSAEVDNLEEGTYYCAYCLANMFNDEDVIGNVVSFTISSSDLDETVRTGNPFSSSNYGDYQLIGYASICPSDFPNSSFSAYFRCKTDGEDERLIYVENDYAIYRNEDYGLWEFGGWSFDLTRGKLYEYVFCINIDGEEYRGETKTIWTDPVVETLPASIEALISTGQNSNTRYRTVFEANVSEGYNVYMYISSDRTIVSTWYNLNSACDAGKAVKIALHRRGENEVVGNGGNYIGSVSASDKEILGSASMYYFRVYAEAPVSYPNYDGTYSWKPDEYGEIRETDEINEVN